MTAAVFAAVGLTALAVFFFLLEGESLNEGHARVRTKLLNTTRWAFVIALAWVLIPAAFTEAPAQRGATILGMGALLGALMLVPVRWFVRVGGREPVWELRRCKIEVAQLGNRIRREPSSVTAARLQDEIDRIEALRLPATNEMCDLLSAELHDLQRGAESWNEAGRRGVRIDQIGREMWPGAMPPPEFEPEEATFRWHLYRDFGRLMDIAVTDLSPDDRDEFRHLLESLDRYRRADTTAFITDVRKSGLRWLAEGNGEPWIEAFDFRTLGPNGLAEVRALWGRDAAMWGAQLDDADRTALREDLARRSAEDAAAAPAAPAEPESEPETRGTPVMAEAGTEAASEAESEPEVEQQLLPLEPDTAEAAPVDAAPVKEAASKRAVDAGRVAAAANMRGRPTQ